MYIQNTEERDNIVKRCTIFSWFSCGIIHVLKRLIYGCALIERIFVFMKVWVIRLAERIYYTLINVWQLEVFVMVATCIVSEFYELNHPLLII